MLWEIKKFNKEIRELQKLKGLSEVGLSPVRQAQLKSQVMEAIARPQVAPKNLAQDTGSKWWPAFDMTRMSRYAFSVLLGLTLLGGTAFASNTSIPGDWLYPIKRLSENIQLNLAASENSKAALEFKFAKQRLVELKTVLEQQDQPNLSADDHSNFNAKNTPTQPANQFGSTSASSQSQKWGRLQIQARTDADSAVTRALQALEQVQNNLQAKGQNQAAASVNRQILDLQFGADAQGLELPKDNRQKPGDINNDFLIPSSSSPESQVNQPEQEIRLNP